MTGAPYDVVIPTIGRPSLAVLIASLAAASGPLPERVIVVDDRRDRREALRLGETGVLTGRITLVAGDARGPAAARNRGWRAANAAWVAFVDDDVILSETWRADLTADLAACSSDVVGVQGILDVPLPRDRRPTDWERNVAGLATARWITADLAYRREGLVAVDGFDERFPRAFREDADIALRLVAHGYRLAQGTRHATHPVRPADMWVSVRLQAGNADDALMSAVHGKDWHERAAADRGTFAQHVVTSSLAVTAALAAAGWVVATARFAWRRIEPGPRDAREIKTMLATSTVLPLAAVYHRIRGAVGIYRLRRELGR